MKRYKKTFLQPIELVVSISDEEIEETKKWVIDTYGEDSDDLIDEAIMDLIDDKFYCAVIEEEKYLGIKLIPDDDSVEKIGGR